MDRDKVNADRLVVGKELNRIGLATHEVQEASVLWESLGVRGDGVEGTIRPTPARRARLRLALTALINRRPVSGQDLEKVVGHILTVALLNRVSAAI